MAQLLELKGLLEKTMPEYAVKIADLENLIQEEKVRRNEAIDQEKMLTKTAESERDVWKQQAENCSNNLKTVTKGRSFGCWMKKIFSAWTSGCR